MPVNLIKVKAIYEFVFAFKRIVINDLTSTLETLWPGLDEGRDQEGSDLQHQLPSLKVPGSDDALATVPDLHYGEHIASAVSGSRYSVPITPALPLLLVTMS